MFTPTSLALASAALLAGATVAHATPGMSQDKGKVAQGNANLQLELSLLGRYDSGIRDASGAEIVAHDPATQRLFVVNAADSSVDVLDISNPATPTRFTTLVEDGGDANSVAIANGLVVVVFAADPKTEPGKAVFYDAGSLERLGEFATGALPDMVTFTPDGAAVLIANEGEPSDYNSEDAIDPEGSVTVIDLRDGLGGAVVRTAAFSHFNDQGNALRASGVRLFGPGATAAQDLEPEYIAIAPDGKSAWVVVQESNAAAVLDLSDLDDPRFTRIVPFGLKDHSLPGNALDVSDRDDAINIRNWPIKGMYMPDAVAAYQVKGQTYYVTANEGDARDYDNFGEESRVENLTLASSLVAASGFASAEALQAHEALGRLTVSATTSPRNADDEVVEIHAFGARSFSIWSAAGEQVFDSGDQLERITAERFPLFFNASNSNNDFDNRSDDKGPEPEGVTVGKIRGRTFAFIGLERIGGVMVYDVTDPRAARFVDYINTRDFTVAPDGEATNDSGAEGLAFIAAEDSPTGKPLLALGNEVSGTTVLLAIDIVRK